MTKTSKWASLASVAILAMPLTLSAQDEEGADDAPPPLSDVWMMVVKPGMAAEFNEAMAAHLAFRKNAGESRDWQAYRVEVGHDMRPIQFRSCCFNWADMDTFDAEATEIGLVEHFQETVGEYVDHFHHYLERTDWENSHWPDSGTSGPFYAVTTWTNKQGRGPESGEAKKALSQVGKTEGWTNDDNNWLWLSRIGGDYKTAIVSSYENYADMEPPEQSYYDFVVEKLGEVEANELYDAWANGFDDSEYTIWRHDESLSTPADEDAED
jgi:hypothetical protein